MKRHFLWLTLVATLTSVAMLGPSFPASGQAERTVLIRYAGQVLDYQGGFVFFTTGDGYRMRPDARIVSYPGGAPTAAKPSTGMYARATFDPADGGVTELAISRGRIPSDSSYDKIRQFAIAASTPAPNPDLAQSASAEGFNGKPVLVTFTVQVPPGTPLGDDVYLSTDASGWNALAFKMDRVDGLHYRLTREINSGTKLRYLYTRGSWQSVERGKDGLEVQPHQYTVRNLDIARRDDVVYHWSDENPAQQNVGPNTLPTPFNPRPFALPSSHRP